jgi:acetyl-CoA C-acetyltransferase
MTDVIIAGIGQTDVGEHWEISLRELALAAIEAAIQDAHGIRPGALLVSNMLAPIISGQAHLGALIADFAGMTGIEATSIEGAGASGGLALRQAYLMILAGACEAALVVGVEKTTDQIGSAVESAISSSIDSDFEAIQGMTPTAQAALLMRRYMHEFQVERKAFAGFPVIAHANAEGNPHAMYRKAITPEAYQRAGIVSDPLNIYDVAPAADGAAAVLLTRRDLLPPKFSHPLVRISGSSSVSDSLALHDRRDPLDFRAARLSVERACRQAGILPEDTDLFELYDAYSIYSVLALEAAGFAPRGQGWKLAQDGALALNGKLPIATLGGLKARGNPGGATGVYQVVEAVLQLRSQAGVNQIKGARRALVQSLGGPAASAVTHVLEAVTL